MSEITGLKPCNVSIHTFQDEFTELTKPGSRLKRSAESLPNREKYRFGIRPLLIRFIIDQGILSDPRPAEFSVSNHWFHVFCTPFIPQQPAVVFFACCDY